MRKYLDAYAPSLGELWLVVMVLFCIGGNLVSAAVAIVIDFLFNLDPDVSKLVIVGLYPLGFCLVIPFVLYRAKEQYQRNLFAHKPHFASPSPHFGISVVLVFLLLLVLVPVFGTAIEPLTMWIPMPEVMKSLFSTITQSGWISFVSVVVMAPVLEEWLLRGVALKGLLRAGASPAYAIGWSALMFGVMHMNPWQAIPAILMGMLFGWIYWRTRSLWATIFMHAVNNGTAFFIGLFFPELPEDVSTLDLVGRHNYPWVLAVAVLATILIIWLLHKNLAPAPPLFKREEQPVVAP